VPKRGGIDAGTTDSRSSSAELSSGDYARLGRRLGRVRSTCSNAIAMTGTMDIVFSLPISWRLESCQLRFQCPDVPIQFAYHIIGLADLGM